LGENIILYERINIHIKGIIVDINE